MMKERSFGSITYSPRQARAEAFARFNPTMTPGTKYDYENPSPRPVEKKTLRDMLREAVENTARMQTTRS